MAKSDLSKRATAKTKKKRGRKAQPKNLTPLPVNPPGLIGKAEKAAYARIRKLCLSSGRVASDDVEMVIQVASTLAYLDRLKKEVDALPSLMSLGGNGNDRVHPLAIELRQTNSSYRQALGQLMLSPRSRSASRLTKGGLIGNGDTGIMGQPIPPRNSQEERLFGSGPGG